MKELKMDKRFIFRVLVVVCFVGVVFSIEECIEAKELVSNPTFKAAETEKLPAGWSVWRPVWDKAACRFKSVGEGLLVEAEDPYAVGGVIQEINGINGGQAYAVKAVCQLHNIPAPYQSVLVRLSWTRKGKLLHPAGMLVRETVLSDDLVRFDDVLIAHPDADSARLSLEVKWPQGGSVIWKQASLQATSRPEPRKVKVGTVYLRPRNSTPENNLKLWCEQIDTAGKLGLDIVCLGEAMTMVGTGCSVKDCAEPMPGPATRQLADAARRNRIWVVAGLTEQVGDVVYNTAVLLDRKGRIAGKYRKVHLPREEWKNGIRPGNTYPVFETDFGKVAIQICYDWFFPEPAQIFALKGAEIIFAPTWGNTLPDEAGRVNGETTFRVRARDNGLYMVPSVYSGNSLVIDPMGRILASSEGKEGVFWAEIDLSEREALQWVGYWRSIGPRHRMVESYGPLLKAPRKSSY
jgi:predicted amidohydrolase